jgi:hypothetical protein
MTRNGFAMISRSAELNPVSRQRKKHRVPEKYF